METTQNAQTQEVDVSSVYLPEYCREVTPECQDKITRDIQNKGLIQEIVVAEMPDGRKELVAGKRRFKAVQKLGWQKVRARVLPIGINELDKELVRIAENEEREDVNPFDRAQSYDRAVKAGVSQQELAAKVGVSERVVSGVMALLSFSPEVTAELRQRNLSATHLQELVRLPDAESQSKLAKDCDEQGWSMKTLRDNVSRALAGGTEKPAEPAKPPKEVPLFQFTWKKDAGLLIRAQYSPEKPLDGYFEELRAALEEFLTRPQRKAQASQEEVRAAA